MKTLKKQSFLVSQKSSISVKCEYCKSKIFQRIMSSLRPRSMVRETNNRYNNLKKNKASLLPSESLVRSKAKSSYHKECHK